MMSKGTLIKMMSKEKPAQQCGFIWWTTRGSNPGHPD
nr:MAG TPA: hypothetical protein [Caudoviricetes sp.]